MHSEVDARRIGVEDVVQWSLVLEGANLRLEEDIAVPPFKNLKVVGGPSVSTQVSLVNGRMSQTKIYTWMLKPLAVGPAEIGAVRLKHAGRRGHGPRDRRSRWRPASLRPEEPARPTSPFGADPFGPSPLEEMFGGHGAAPWRASSSSRPSPAAAGCGWERPSSSPTTSMRAACSPRTSSRRPTRSIPGFWAESIETKETPREEQVTVDGEAFVRFPIHRKLLFPTKAGTLTIPALTLRVSLGRESLFDPGVSVTRSTKPVKLEVEPLPARRGRRRRGGALQGHRHGRAGVAASGRSRHGPLSRGGRGQPEVGRPRARARGPRRPGLRPAGQERPHGAGGRPRRHEDLGVRGGARDQRTPPGPRAPVLLLRPGRGKSGEARRRLPSPSRWWAAPAACRRGCARCPRRGARRSAPRPARRPRSAAAAASAPSSPDALLSPHGRRRFSMAASSCWVASPARLGRAACAGRAARRCGTSRRAREPGIAKEEAAALIEQALHEAFAGKNGRSRARAGGLAPHRRGAPRALRSAARRLFGEGRGPGATRARDAVERWA